MVKSEVRRLTSDKLFLIIFFGVLAFFIILLTIYLLTLKMEPAVAEGVKDIDELMATYQRRYDYYKNWYLYSIGEGECPDPNEVFAPSSLTAKEQMLYYEYLLSHSGWREYFEFNYDFDFWRTSSTYRGVGCIFWIMRFAFFPLIIFAIISAIISCVAPYDRGKMKNYFASPVGKRTIMGGKLFAWGLVNFVVWLIIFIWGLILGASNASVMVGFYTGEKYYAQPLLASFTTVMLQTLIAMLFTGCLTVLLGQFIKKPLATGVASVFAVVVIICLCSATFAELPWEFIEYPDYGYMKYFPIISLYGQFHHAADYRMWVAILFHLLVGAGMVAFIILRQTRGEKRYFKTKSQ